MSENPRYSKGVQNSGIEQNQGEGGFVMSNKENYISSIVQTREILQKYSLDDLIIEVDTLRDELINFKVKVLFVGGFSAGKTALINSLLETDLLEENIVPETAIATEIVYGQEEKVLLIDKNQETISCCLDDINRFSVQDYFKYCYIVNNSVLKSLAGYVIVDMPGFDSGVEQHNKALIQYIDQGIAYVLVVDCEKGAVSQSTLNFLTEIKAYSKNIGFILNKCDKRISSDIEYIKNKASNDIKKTIGYSPFIVTTSKYEDDISEKVCKIIESFQPQILLKDKFNDRLIFFIENISSTLTTIKSSLEFDPYEIDLAINKREKAKKALIDSMRFEKLKLHNKVQIEAKSTILSDIKNALVSNAAMLASSAQAGGQAFSQTVNNIIRPVIIASIERNIEVSFNEFIGNLQIEQMKNLGTDDIAQKTSILLAKLQEISSKASSYKGLYKTVLTTLAITTSVVAPWLELLLIFLPDIMKLFSGIMQSNQLDLLQSKIVNEVVPNIQFKLEPEIKKSLVEIENQMLAEIEAHFNNLIDLEISALNELKKLKNEKLFSLEKCNNDIDVDLKKLQEIAAKFSLVESHSVCG